MQVFGERPGVIASQNAARRVLQISPRDHQFHAGARARDQDFHAQAAPEPHIFYFAVAHTYQNVGRVPPPPPHPRPIHLNHT